MIPFPLLLALGLSMASPIVIAARIESSGDLLRFNYNGDGPYSTSFSIIGSNGEAFLSVRDGGQATINNGAHFGYWETGIGHLLIKGPGSLLDAAAVIGFHGVGDLEILDGGRLRSASSGIVAYYPATRSSTAMVRGAGSVWETGGAMLIGLYGHGVLTIRDGGQVQCGGQMESGGGGSAFGELIVQGKNSRLRIDDKLHLGVFGRGELQLLDGGTAIVADLSLGTRGGSGEIWMAGGRLVWQGDQRGQLAALRSSLRLYNGADWESGASSQLVSAVYVPPSGVDPADPLSAFAGHTVFEGGVSLPAPPPDQVVIEQGGGQRVNINEDFPLPLTLRVIDSEGDPASGIPVTFSAPTSGPGAIFGGAASITVTTDAEGVASSGAITANSSYGRYQVLASADGVADPAVFDLENGTSLPSVGLAGPAVDSGMRLAQTGLVFLTARATNTTPLPVNGLRIEVDWSAYLADDPTLRLFNASGGTGETAFVDHPYPVAVGETVSLNLGFYSSGRQLPESFAPVLTARILDSSQLPDTQGSGVNPRVVEMRSTGLLLEFPTVPGRWYRVRYSEDGRSWRDCPVPLQASGNRLQWIDAGPPFTDVAPSRAPRRMYLVNEIKDPG